PEALNNAKVKLVDADGEDTGVLAYTFTGAATVQKVTLPVNTMPEEAGMYQVVVESANYQGSATLTFVEPVFTATPAELLANSSNVVTFTSTNVEDLRAVTSVTATGAVKSITAKIAEEAITATIVTAAEKGTVKVVFKFNRGYEHEVELSSVYGKLTVENATIAFGTKVLAFTPVNAAGATLAAGTEVKINLLGNEYSGYVAADGSVKILIPELPMGTYSVLVKVAGYQDATFSLVVVEAEAEPEYKTVIELAPGMDIYTVNGETKFWDATPYIKEGRTLVPIRHLAEAVGFKASWDFSDPANKMVFIFKADQDPEKDKEHPFILLIIGQPTAMVSGNLVALDVAPEILNGRTMVPLRFVVETLGYKVEWLGNTIRLMK
ncbi:MAG: copper amine oxidase N-terminal domain-containing protein, partial [Coprothermobacter proteolyticus]